MTSLSEFLPGIKNVDIRMTEDSQRVRYRRDFEVFVDDGTPTNIEYKGDGVKSLAALALLKNRKPKSGASIIAIEEPESHLHSGAIHQLKEIISALEDKNQIVITTHNPLFVNRSSVSSNIIVDNGGATKASNVTIIRDILGVRISDNLTSSRIALVVEGKEDLTALNAILPALSQKIGTLLKNQQMTILSTRGAGGLSYLLSTLEGQCCEYYVLLDHDQAANEARDKAIQHGLLSTKTLTQTICKGMKESEFEDCLHLPCYQDKIISEYGVDLTLAEFRGNQKWSIRMKKAFEASGKDFTDDVKSKVKATVAEAVTKSPATSLCPHKRLAIDGLVRSLEAMAEQNKI